MEEKLVGAKATEVIELLTSPGAKLKIVSIVGMPGLGKTKLANSVFNHASISMRFGIRVWCFASQSYKKEDLLSEIMTQIGGNSSESGPGSDRDPAQEVYRSLKGRKYLIVIDDVWDAELWSSLKQIIPDDRKGSRILFTTRHRAVALQANSISYPLRLLSNEESYQLLVAKVLDVGEACSGEMRAILKRVARNCNGLPLAIVLIAGILKTTERKKDSWRLVSETVIDLYQKHGKSLGVVHLVNVLTLSYKHLPDFLKPCFLYFGAVPKVSTIPVSMLIRLWISEGFVAVEEGVVNAGLEERGRAYLNELVDRSLVMVDRASSQNGAKTCRIHDVLRDFCRRTLEKHNFLSQEHNFGGILFLRGNLERQIQSCLYQYRSDRAIAIHVGRGLALPPVARKGKSSHSSMPSRSPNVVLPPVARKGKSSRTSMSSKSPRLTALSPIVRSELPSLIVPSELPPVEESSLIMPPLRGSSHSYHSSRQLPTVTYSSTTTSGGGDRTYSTGQLPQPSRKTVSTRSHTQVNTPPRRLEYSYLLNHKRLQALDLGNVRFESSANPSDFAMIATTLVDLTYLAIRLRGNEVPVEIGNLQKLQTLVLNGVIGTILFPDSFGKLWSLRHLLTDHGFFTFEHCSQRFFDNFSPMGNLKSISHLVLRPGCNAEKYILKMLTGLQKLGCRFVAHLWDSSVEHSVFPKLEFLTELTSLKIFFSSKVLCPCKFSFPSSLTKLCMSNSRLPWDQMSLIAQLLPNLQVLKLLSRAFQGELWDTGAGDDQEFAKLKFLKLESLDIEKWEVYDAHHFPSLEQLVVLHCEQLQEIPSAIGEIPTLKLIEMKWCSPSASASATQVLQLQRDFSNLDLNLTLVGPVSAP